MVCTKASEAMSLIPPAGIVIACVPRSSATLPSENPIERNATLSTAVSVDTMSNFMSPPLPENRAGSGKVYCIVNTVVNAANSDGKTSMGGIVESEENSIPVLVAVATGLLRKSMYSRVTV